MTNATIEALSDLTAVEPRPGEGQQQAAKRLVYAADKAFEAAAQDGNESLFEDTLAQEGQDWFNAAVEAMDEGEEIPPPPGGWDEEEEAEPGAEEAEPEPEPELAPEPVKKKAKKKKAKARKVQAKANKVKRYKPGPKKSGTDANSKFRELVCRYPNATKEQHFAMAEKNKIRLSESSLKQNYYHTIRVIIAMRELGYDLKDKPDPAVAL